MSTESDSVEEILRPSDSSESSKLSTDEENPFINTLWGIHETLSALRGKMSRQKLEDGDPIDEPSDIDDKLLPSTYLVVQIAPKVPLKTLTWLIDKIRGPRRDGSGGLIVMRQPGSPEDGYTFHISASKLKFLEVAEEMDLIKEDRQGVMREFTVAQFEDFLKDGMHLDDILTNGEKQNLVRHELENIRALAEDNHIPGYSTYSLYEGQSIFQVCQMYGIITKMYPLHDEETLKKLGPNWYMTIFGKQPVEEIRLYFGEAVALYFVFLGFYTYSLSVPVILGFLQMLVDIETVPFFCLFNFVWVTLVLEMWKRRSNELAFRWGTIGMTSMDEPRPNFRGIMAIDPVTSKLQPQSPRYLTYTKMYAVSIPIVFVCMVLAFTIMLVSFWAEDYVKQAGEDYQQYIMLPSIIYSIVVFIMNMYYRKLATYLTEWENHRTQSQYERHRCTKLVLFEFVNNFLSLFYIAFIIGDMDMLRSQVQTMLIISQAITNFQETVQPLALKYYALKVGKVNFTLLKKSSSINKTKVFVDQNSKVDDPLADLKVPELQPDDPRVKQAIEEGEMEPYEETYDDYLELYIQFGYVFLFSSVYPIAAFWAVLNNVLEIRADAFKLCKVYQRPMSRRVKDIGAWQRAFEVMGAISIMTNCGILYLNPQMRSTIPSLREAEWLFLFVILEHVLLGIRYLLHIAISDKPEWVRVALAKSNYESKQALKFERAQKRRTLTRKFKTVHGPLRY